MWSRDLLLMSWRVVKSPILTTLQNIIGGRLSSMLDIFQCVFAKWACWTCHTSAFFHGSRCKDKGRTSLWENVPQTYHCQESSPSRSCQDLRRSGDRGRRVPHSSGTSTTAGSNIRCLCLVVSWRCNRYLWWCILRRSQFGRSTWNRVCLL